MKKALLLICTTLFATACSTPSVKSTQSLSGTADAPYDNILVVALFESFDLRRFFEEETARQLETKGVQAVPSSHHMKTTTPVNRETLMAIVNDSDSDSVLVVQLVDLQTETEWREANPQSTYNIRPTYYYNVWNVELTEYESPGGLDLTHTYTMAVQMFSVKGQDAVWAIETTATMERDINQQTTGTNGKDEIHGIVSALSRDGLLVGN